MKKVDLVVTTVQVILTAIQMGGLVPENAVAVEPPRIEVQDRLTVEEYMKWACHGNEKTTTVRSGQALVRNKLTPQDYQLGVCRLKEDDGERILDCKTAHFGRGVSGLTQRDAVERAINDCLERQ